MKNLKKILTVGLIIAFALVALIPLSGGFATSKKQLTVWSHLTQDEVKALQPIADKWGKANGYTVKASLTKVHSRAFRQLQ